MMPLQRWIFVLLLCFVDATYGCNFQSDSGPFHCETLQYSQYCRFGYENTSVPNMFNHTSQDMAAEFFQSHFYLYSLNCSVYAEYLLCFSIFPLCVSNHFKRVEPCRELCLAVRESCLSTLRFYGLPWPRDLDCSRFKPSGSALCIWRDNARCGMTAPTARTVLTTAGTVLTTAGTNRHVATTIASTSPPTGHTNTHNCSGHLAFYPNNSRTEFGGIKDCAESCSGVFFSKSQQEFTQIWITSWSLLCLLISVVTFLTYILNFKQIPSLESPIYFIALCYVVVAFTYTLSVAVGRNALICHHEFTNEFNDSILAAEGLDNLLCVTIFSLLYYFTLCSWTWWLVLASEWLLCTLKCTYINIKWQVWFHVVAWGIPLILVFCAVILGHVTGDPVLRTCWIRKHHELPFLIVPLSVIILLCSCVVLVCFGRVVSIQRNTQETNIKKMNTIKPIVLIRVGIFCTVFLIPMGLLLCCYWYEYWYRTEWEEWYLQCNGRRSEGEGPRFEIFMVKLAASLTMGIVTVGWILRKSSLLAWKRACCFWQTKQRAVKYNPTTIRLQIEKDRCSSQFTFTETSV